MSQPLVSIIMSAHNEEEHISKAVKSILNQTYHDFELIVIDDYSTDRSAEICRSFSDQRIRVHVKSTEPPYLSASRNLGIRMARGQYTMFQDADDTSHHRRLAEQLALAMEKPGNTVVGTWVRRVQDGAHTIMRLPADHDNIVKGFSRVRNRTTMVPGTILAPTALLRTVQYRQRFRYMQDWDHILRLHESRMALFANCTTPLYNYYIRPKGVIHRPQWLDHNIYVRHCQHRRRRGLPECATLEQFLAHLERHPVERCAWSALRFLIRLNLWHKGWASQRAGKIDQQPAQHDAPTFTDEVSFANASRRAACPIPGVQRHKHFNPGGKA